MFQTKPVVDLLTGDSSWRGFQEARRLIQGIKTRAEARALAQAVERADFTSRKDYPARSVRVAVAGSLSTANFQDALLLQCLERGLFCAQYHGPFGQLAQEIREPTSGLYQHQPDLVVLVPSPNALLPANDSFSRAAAERLIETLLNEVAILRSRFAGPVLIQNFLSAEARPLGLLDLKQDLGHADFYRLLNLTLSEKCRSQRGLYVLDAAHLATHCGLDWTSLHKPLFLASCATPDRLAMMVAREIAAAAAALKGFAKKCLVVDLDNTLWGGVIGEDGVANIAVGGGFPGNLYVALQQQIVSLFDRGVILAINSKNNERDAWEAFESRPEMILQRKHFSSVRINWHDKVTNLAEIAGELNIGLDSLVVLDDSAVERHMIETALPEVQVIPAEDPLQMLRFLATSRLFDTLTFTSEDSLRAKSYAAVAERNRLLSETSDVEQLLHSLELVVELGTPAKAQIGRVAQLTQKTNQFTLTTRRYSDEEIVRRLQSSEWEVFACSCRDKFADEGTTGVALVHREQGGDVWAIDTFLLSCRVLGRGVERAFLAWICAQAHAAGARQVSGEFIRTDKNGQTENFYGDHGFSAIASNAGHSRWQLPLPAPRDLWPSWIRLTTTDAQGD